jgi:histidinol-phosphatase
VTAGSGADLALALELADIADDHTLPPFEARSFTVAWKADDTEVTDVDRETEGTLVEHLRRARPHDSVLGEEGGLAGASGATRQWIIDPIDGTSGFSRGMPIWATLIALADGDDLSVAVVSAPALGRRWWATRGGGASCGGHPIRVSTVDRLADAQVSVTFNDGWDDLGLTGALVDLQRAARRGRGVGDFWQHMLVAEGAMDVAVDAIGVAPYDVAAVKLIVEEAGGTFTDRHGAPRFDTGSAISSNGVLHSEVLARLATGT